MFLLLMLASNWFGSDVEKLGHDSWHVREAAQRRLRLGGVLSIPAVFGAVNSDDPEVRHRARQLAAPWLSWLADLRAAAVLCDPWPLTQRQALAFWADEELRHRVARIADKKQCGEFYTQWITDTRENCWWWEVTRHGQAAWALQSCRQMLGYEAPWFLRN